MAAAGGPLVYGLTTSNALELFAIGRNDVLYVVDPATGAATARATLSVPLNGTVFGVDLDPVPDRLRIVSDTRQNLRVNVDTGETVADGALAYRAGDPGAGSSPVATAAGYTNSVGGTHHHDAVRRRHRARRPRHAGARRAASRSSST